MCNVMVVSERAIPMIAQSPLGSTLLYTSTLKRNCFNDKIYPE